MNKMRSKSAATRRRRRRSMNRRMLRSTAASIPQTHHGRQTEQEPESGRWFECPIDDRDVNGPMDARPLSDGSPIAPLHTRGEPGCGPSPAESSYSVH